jgi:hypothetical protein
MPMGGFAVSTGPPVALAVALGAATIALSARVPPLYEARVGLETAPVPLLREFNAAVDGRARPRTAADDRLERQDLGDLSLAARDARTILAGSARNAKLEVELKGELREFDLVARAPSPRTSAGLANAFARALVVRRNQRIDQRVRGLRASLLMLDPLSANSAAARRRAAEARAELRRLRPLHALPGGGISIIETAEVPRERISRLAVRNGLVAALLGVLVGFTPAVGGTSWGKILQRVARSRLAAVVQATFRN